MSEETKLGTNRTGIATSPIEAKRTVEGAIAGTPAPLLVSQDLHTARTTFATDSEPIGSMPMPATLKGVAKTAAEALKGHSPTVFLDLIGERLAFERTGTRLYDALLAKVDANRDPEIRLAREDLEQIRDEELAHFGMLVEAMRQLGADPTAMTPSADVAAVLSHGVLSVLVDPRTSVMECLKAILVAELVDNDCWLTLADLAARLGHENLAQQFRDALQQEEEHLARVRTWVNGSTERDAGLTPMPPGAGARI